MNLYRSAGAYIPSDQSKCWARLTTCMGTCEKKARPGKLTCWHHQNSERNAQKLKAELYTPNGTVPEDDFSPSAD